MRLFVLALLPCAWQSLAEGGLGDFENKPEWGEGEDSGKVIFMNDEHFASYRENTDKFLAFFYAPWCGHCKNTKPHYAKASINANLPMIALDCTASSKKTCETFGVSGYPTIKFFSRKISGGAESVEPEGYSGGRNAEDFLSYVNKAHDPKWTPPPNPAWVPFVNKPEWGEDSGNVVFQTDDHFEAYAHETQQFLAFFYAPWCGHCKTAKPHYGKASLKVKVPMVAVDCTGSGSNTCSNYKVTGYPSIKFFQNAESIDYTGARTESGFVNFLQKKAPDYVPEPYSNIIPEAWQVNMTNGNVKHVGDEHFDEFSKKHERMIGFFYAPWCGHCKAAKPDYALASTRYRRGIAFVAFDCTSEAATICQKFNVSSFPTVKYIAGKTNETIPPDGGGWGSGDFIALADKKLADAAKGTDGKLNFKKMRVKHMRKWLKDRGLKCRGCAEKRDFINLINANLETPLIKENIPKKTKGMTLMEEKRFKTGLARAENGWKDESYGNGNVKHFASQISFDNFLEKENTDGCLVMFYAPWCGHCKQLKPKYVQVSIDIQKQGNKGIMAAIDAEFAKESAAKYSISSYPTMKYFARGKTEAQKAEMNGASLMSKDLLTEFMMKKADPDWVKPPPKPFANTPQWGDDSGDVVFMDDGHFNKYKDNAEQFLAFFYAPWCGHCKKAKPHYGKASLRTSIPMLAIDCTDSGQETCKKFKVDSYPTLKWFADDDYEDYEGARTEKDFLQFLDDQAAENDDDFDDPEEEQEKTGAEKEKQPVDENEEHEEDLKKDEL